MNLISNISSVKKKTLITWKFLENTYGLWSYFSTETGYLKKVGTEWQWESLSHTKYTKSGTYIGTTVSVSHTGDVATVGLYHAGIKIYWEFTGSLICNGFPITKTTTSYSQSPLFAAYQEFD